MTVFCLIVNSWPSNYAKDIVSTCGPTYVILVLHNRIIEYLSCLYYVVMNARVYLDCLRPLTVSLCTAKITAASTNIPFVRMYCNITDHYSCKRRGSVEWTFGVPQVQSKGWKVLV